MSLKLDHCWCAFCRLERRVYRKRHLSFINLLLALLLSLVATVACWQRVDARVLFIFVVFAGLAEVFIQVRWRLTLTCPFCGFDPILYLRDREAAALKVKMKLESSRGSSLLLSPHNPWTHLGPMMVKSSKARRNKKPPVQSDGSVSVNLLSRQI